MSIDPINFEGDDPKKMARTHYVTKSGRKKQSAHQTCQDPKNSNIHQQNVLHGSDSSSTTDSDTDDLTLNKSNVLEDSNDIFHIPETQSPTQPQKRFFDRYRQSDDGITPMTRLALSPRQSATQHFIITRNFTWYGGAKRKIFELISNTSAEPLARADYESALSSTLQVMNSRGMICEIDTKKPSGPYNMRVGSDIYITIKGGPGRLVDVEFFSVDGSKPPYPHLQSASGICNNLETAFGKRKAIQSVKNGKFMSENNEEIVAVRKVSKNRLEIDAKYNILFLHCFCIGLYMFTTK